MIQKHLTAAGLQAYLEWLQSILTVEMQDRLMASSAVPRSSSQQILSLLPENGISISLLAEAIGIKPSHLREQLQTAEDCGIISHSKSGTIAFTHDSHRVSAHR